jgi:hypothetical protein
MLAHPWTSAAIAAVIVLVAWFGLSLSHGQMDGKSMVIGLVAAVVVFLGFGLVISAYRSTSQ